MVMFAEMTADATIGWAILLSTTSFVMFFVFMFAVRSVEKRTEKLEERIEMLRRQANYNATGRDTALPHPYLPPRW